MIMHSLSRYSLIVFLLLLPGHPADSLQAATFEAQTNREGTVMVKVTPMNISRAATSWDFEITFDTHTDALNQDMSRAAVLVDGSNVQQPLAWEGDPSGGHHRKGVLRFRPLPDSPEFLELHVNGVGGVSQRVFRWRMTE